MKKMLIAASLLLGSYCSYAYPVGTNGVSMNSHPLSFLQNKGQLKDQNDNPRPDIDFKLAASPNLSVFVGAGAIHYQFSKVEKRTPQPDIHGQNRKAREIVSYSIDRMDVELMGCNKNAVAISEKELAYTENYILQGNGNETITAHSYDKVVYKDIYPHIDWVLSTNSGKLKHEFVVWPGGKVSDIKLKYGGANKLELNGDGSLIAGTPQGDIQEQAPVSYDAKGIVKSKFILRDSVVSYDVSKYSGTLVIDPTLIWATYWGGGGDEDVYEITTDPSGNVYLGGNTESPSLATAGAYQTIVSGSGSGFAAKFSSAGTIIWATYYSPPTAEEAHGIAVDASMNVYLTGYAGGSTGLATAGAHQTVVGGSIDAYLAKFSPSGSLLWATYYGGTVNEEGHGVVTDAAGNVYMTGYSESPTNIATPGAFKTSNSFSRDAFLVKFNSLGVRQWGTYFGGTLDEAWNKNCIGIDGADNIYIAGWTFSTTGLASPGAHKTTGSGADGYLAKFSSSGARLWSTFYGGTMINDIKGIACDAALNVYIAGHTNSTSGIATTGSYQATLSGSGPQDGFLVKFDAGGVRQWGTYFGGTLDDKFEGVACGPTGNIYVTGTTQNTGLATPAAYQTSLAGASDAILTVFDNTGARLWSSYYGGSNTEEGKGVAVTGTGEVYITGNTYSASGIATPGAFDVSYNGSDDAYLAKFDICLPPATGTISGSASICESTTTTLSATLIGGTWSTSDGVVATVSGAGVVSGLASGTATISYTFSNVCGSASATMVITVNALPVAGSISGPLGVCAGNTITLSASAPGGSWTSSNTIVAPISSGGVVSGSTPGTTTISYTVTNSCGSASATAVVTVDALPPTATLAGPSTVCAGNVITLTASTLGGSWTSSNPAKATVDATTGSVTGIAAGTATITYTLVNGCGSTIATYPITIGPALNPGTISGPSTVCTGSSVTLSSTGTPGGVWSSSAPGMATVSGSGVVSGSTVGTTMISYTVSSSCGSASTTAVVTVLPTTASTITGPGTVCAGSTITLSCSPAGGSWSSSVTSVATASASGVIAGLGLGTTIISYTIVNSCGTAITTLPVTVTTFPATTTISGPTTVCAGSIITLSAAAAGGTWSSPGSIATVSSAGLVTGVAAGGAAVSYTRTNSCGSTISTHTISVLPLPNAGAISGPSAVCVGGSITLSESVSGGVWSSSAASVATVSSSGVVTGVSNGTVNIVFTVTNSCGAATATKTVTVGPTAGSIAGATSICVGGFTTLSNIVSGGSWTSSATGVATIASSGLVTGMSGGTTTITYTVSNSCGTSTATQILTVIPLPGTTTITGLDTVCKGANITLIASQAGGTWSAINGRTTVAGGVVTGVGFGIDTVIYTVTNACGSANAKKKIFVKKCITETEQVLINAIKITPNPTRDHVTISAAETIYNIVVTDMSGRKLFKEAYDAKSVNVSLENYAPGAYLITINEAMTYKIIKE